MSVESRRLAAGGGSLLLALSGLVSIPAAGRTIAVPPTPGGLPPQAPKQLPPPRP